jgi:hypothetical protein
MSLIIQNYPIKPEITKNSDLIYSISITKKEGK